MKKVVIYPDGSDYSARLLDDLEAVGIETVAISKLEELETVVDAPTGAVVVVNPHHHSGRVARSALRKAGGQVSRIPLVAAVWQPEMLLEHEVLSKFDDFLVSPGSALELAARVSALAARQGQEGNVIRRGELLINLDAHSVLVGGSLIDCTFKEYELLKMLAATPGRAYTREELLRNIWGYEYFGGTRTVDVHVRRLRAKTEGSRAYIETVHGVGYRFAPQDEGD